MPAAETFWDNIAEKYAASPIKNVEAYEETLARVRAHLKPEDNVLEVGAGTGTTALKLAGDVARITSSDLSGKMMEIARAKAADEGVHNLRFVQATPMDAALEEDAPYDAALAFNLLHLVEDVPGALRHLHALLKPGGLFISKTPCMGQSFSIWPLVVPIMRAIGKAPYVRFLKVSELEAEIRAAGFEIIDATDIPAGKPNHYVVARKV